MLMLSLAALAAFQAPPALPQVAERDLLGITTGHTQAGSGEIVLVDAARGTVRVLGAIVSPGGHRTANDLVRSRDGRTLLVAQMEFVSEEWRSNLAEVDLATLKVLRTTPPAAGVLDSLCWEPSGGLLATFSTARPQSLVRVDPATGKRAVVAELDVKLWIRSLAFDPAGRLWGLHTRTPELDQDALVRIDPANGAVMLTLPLATRAPAMALEVDAKGRFLVACDDDRLEEIDPASGRVLRSAETRTTQGASVRFVGLERGR